MSVKIDSAIEMTHNALAELDVALLKEVDDLTVEELAKVVVSMHALTRRMKDLEASVDAEIASDLKADEPMQVSGKTITKKVGAGSVKWSTPALKSVVAERVIQNALNPETGEIEAPVSQLVAQALECVSISQWRVGELKNIGLNPELYREKSGSKTRIIVE